MLRRYWRCHCWARRANGSVVRDSRRPPGVPPAWGWERFALPTGLVRECRIADPRGNGRGGALSPLPSTAGCSTRKASSCPRLWSDTGCRAGAIGRFAPMPRAGCQAACWASNCTFKMAMRPGDGREPLDLRRGRRRAIGGEAQKEGSGSEPIGRRRTPNRRTAPERTKPKRERTKPKLGNWQRSAERTKPKLGDWQRSAERTKPKPR